MQLGQDLSHEIGYVRASVSSAMKSTTREISTLLATLFISAYYLIACLSAIFGGKKDLKICDPGFCAASNGVIATHSPGLRQFI
jgi:hypothetical protein